MKHPSPGRGPVARLSDYAAVLLGCAVAAAAFNLFIRPNGLASGGVVGISVLAARLTGLEPAYIQLALNVPLFLLGLAAFGAGFGLKTALGSVLLPLGILLGRGLPALTDDALLAALFGGAGLGLGIGLVFRGGGSVGGLTVLARIAAEKTGLAVGTMLAALDALVIAAAGFVLGPEAALYALVNVVVMGRAVDLVRVGIGVSKIALVMTDRHEALSAAVLHDLDRGLTRLHSQGGYTGAERPTLMVVMDPSIVVRFVALVRSVDPDAFTVILDAHEVLGLGFRSRL